MTKSEFKEALEANNLNHHLNHFESVMRNCIRLHLTPQEDIPLGNSKIGGRPDLPSSISWPVEDGSKSLSFIAQVNLSEITQFDTESLLPQSGILYFFYSADQDAWGFDIKDRNKFRVLFYDESFETLNEIEYPTDLDEYSRFTSCSLEAKKEISILSYSYYEERMKFMSHEEGDRYWDILGEEGEINKMLGYSDSIQNEMELECELVTNGLFCGDPSGYNAPQAKELEPNAVNWRLLLQIDSNEDCGMMWGDGGRLYFWIKEQDLKAKEFSKSWFSLQCY